MNPVPPSAFLARIIRPALDWLTMVTAVSQGRAAAEQFLLAVALQESNLQHRAQVVAGDSTAAGPARGWWQCERPSIALYMKHPASGPRLRQLCDAAWVRFEADDIWRAIEGHDALACAYARLMLLTDPHPIPVTQEEGWRCYNDRLWRPGKPHPQKWPENWRAAQAAIGAA